MSGAYKLQNLIRQEAMKALAAKKSGSLGVVTGYDKDNCIATVELYPADEDSDALQTGWIPVFSPMVGNGWGIFCPPNIGDVVEVNYQEGSQQNAYVGLRSFTNLSPPLPVPSGELWLVHQTGAAIKLTNDGILSLSSTVEINVTAPVVNIDSPVVSLGNLSDSLTGLMNDVAISVYNTHTHNYPDGVTDQPNEPIGSDALTTNVQAN